MPWLPLYADENDIAALVEWLNSEDVIAFIVPDGPKRWRAVSKVDIPHDGRLCLWHSESGPLPLLRKYFPDGRVRNPWLGWSEKLSGADPSRPYFSDHPGIYWLNVNAVSKRCEGGIGLSSFEWIGNWYKSIGKEAPPQTKKWWERLRRHVKRTAVRIPRRGQIDGDDQEIWALPSALARIKSGCARDDNP